VLKNANFSNILATCISSCEQIYWK